MTKTIFRNTFLVGMSVLILCSVLFFGVQYTQRQDEISETLRREAVYATQGYGLSGTDYLDLIKGDDRVMLISPSGEVLHDSNIPAATDNQSGCSEIAAALAKGDGIAVRKTSGDSQSVMYYAIVCEDGNILRISRPISALRYALVAVSPVLWILILVLIISTILSFRAAKQIVTPINALDLDHPEANKYPELAPLIDKVEEQKLTIQNEIAQREQMRRDFTASISREISDPITQIADYSGQLSTMTKEGKISDESEVGLIKNIRREAKRLMTLIGDIVQLSRMDTETAAPEKGEVNLYDLSKDVLAKLEEEAKDQDVTLNITGTEEVIMGVRELLSEMIYNLCDNAVKYNRPGGSVTIDINRNFDDVVLSVIDTGIGIPEEHQARVFERFYRVDKSHSKEIGGTGLGLSIVKHGAQYHDAEVKMKSTPGVGTEIKLIFHKQEVHT